MTVRQPHVLGAAGKARAGSYSGQAMALGAATTFGVTAVVVVGFEDAGGDAITLVFARMVVGALVFGGVAWAISPTLPARRLLVPGLGLGVAFLLASMCLILGYANAPASLVVLLFYVYPLLVVVGAALLLGEAVGPKRIALIAIGMTGLALAIGTPSEFSGLGVALGLGAAAGAAALLLLSRHLLSEGLNVPQVLCFTHVLPAVAAVPLFATGVVSLPPATGEAWTLAIVFALACSVLPQALMIGAIARIGAGLASLLATWEPVVAIALAYLVLDETLAPLQIVGGAFVIAAVAALSLLGPPRGVPALRGSDAESAVEGGHPRRHRRRAWADDPLR